MGTILLVEDDQNLRETLADLLIEQGEYEVITAANGQEGLEKFDLQKVSAILTDLEMPVMNGDQLIHEVRGLSPNTPIVLMSGELDKDGTTENKWAAAVAIRADRAISKSSSNEELLTVIAEAIKIRQS